MITGHMNFFLQLLLDERLEDGHFMFVAMNENDFIWVDVS